MQTSKTKFVGNISNKLLEWDEILFVSQNQGVVALKNN